MKISVKKSVTSIFDVARCETCNLKFETIAILDTHMKVYHGESDHTRIERRMKMAASAIKNSSDLRVKDIATKLSKVYNCTECGEYFSTYDEQRSHEAIAHEERGTKRAIEEAEIVEEHVIDSSEEFTRETYPYIEDGKDDEEADGITFKGKSRKYIGAYNRLREKMVQGAEFIVNGIELKIKNTPKNKPMKVEVKSKEGELGKAQIQMYNPGKKGATLLVTKSSGEGFDVVKTIADVFIEFCFNVHLKDLIKGEEEMKQYI